MVDSDEKARRDYEKAEQILNSSMANLFENVKNECSTYGELRFRLERISKETNWKNPEYASLLHKELGEILRRETDNIPIQR